MPEMQGGFNPMQENNNAKMGTMVWVKRDSVIQPQLIKTGLDDDINVEILEGLKPGDEVILVMEEANKPSLPKPGNGNPFMPGPPGRR